MRHCLLCTFLLSALAGHSCLANFYLPTFDDLDSPSIISYVESSSVLEYGSSTGLNIGLSQAVRSDGVMYENFFWVPSYFAMAEVNDPLSFKTADLIFYALQGKPDNSSWQKISADADSNNFIGLKLIVFNGNLRVIGITGETTIYYKDYTYSGTTTTTSGTTTTTAALTSSGDWKTYTEASSEVTDLTATVLNGVAYLFYIESGTLKWAADNGSGFVAQGDLVRTQEGTSPATILGDDVFSIDVITYYAEGAVMENIVNCFDTTSIPTSNSVTTTESRLMLATLSGETTAPSLALGDFVPTVTTDSTTVSFQPTNLSTTVVPASYAAQGVRLVNGMNELHAGTADIGATIVLAVEAYQGDPDIRLAVASFPLTDMDPANFDYTIAGENFGSPVDGVSGRLCIGQYQVANTDNDTIYDCNDPAEITLNTIQESVALIGLGYVITKDDSAEDNHHDYTPRSSVQFAKTNLLTPYNYEESTAEEPVRYAVITDTANFPEDADTDLVESYVSAWTLVGVMQGAPPFIPNNDISNTSEVTLEWGDSESGTKQTSMSQKTTSSFSASISGNMPLLSANDTYSQSTTTGSGTSQVYDATIAYNSSVPISVNGSQAGTDNTGCTVGTLIFLAPTIINQSFQVTGFDGTLLDVNYFVTSYPCAEVKTFNYDITSPSNTIEVADGVDLALANGMTTNGIAPGSTGQPTLWQPADSNLPKPVALTAGISSITAPAFTISETAWQSDASIGFSVTGSATVTSSTTNTSSNSKNITVAKAARGFGFNVSDTWSDSDSSSLSTTYTLVQSFWASLTVDMSVITVPATPTSTINQFTVQPFILFTDAAGIASWVPNCFANDTPFLVTWLVTNPLSPSDTISGITSGDADGDGIADEYETDIYNTNPNASDSDDDGTSDILELFTFLTNPNNIDSDNDKYNDTFEIYNNYNPNSASSKPSFIADIETAVEFFFTSELDKNYSIQSSPNMTDWTVIESDIAGNGALINRLYPVTEGKILSYQAVEQAAD